MRRSKKYLKNLKKFQKRYWHFRKIVYNISVVLINTAMREWRNRQTRTFEGRVGDRTGSIPVSRTKQIRRGFILSLFVLYETWNLICPSNARIRESGAHFWPNNDCRLRAILWAKIVHEVNLPVFILCERIYPLFLYEIFLNTLTNQYLKREGRPISYDETTTQICRGGTPCTRFYWTNFP